MNITIRNPIDKNLPCEPFGAANFIDFVLDILDRCFLTREPSGSSASLINVADLWEAKILECNHDVLVRIYRSEHIVASRLGAAIGTKYVQVLLIERKSASYEQSRIRRFYLVLHCTRYMINLLTFCKQLGFVILLIFSTLLFVLFVTLWEQS